MKHTTSPYEWEERSLEGWSAQRVDLYLPTTRSLYGQRRWDATTDTILPTLTGVTNQLKFSKEKQMKELSLPTIVEHKDGSILAMVKGRSEDWVNLLIVADTDNRKPGDITENCWHQSSVIEWIEDGTYKVIYGGIKKLDSIRINIDASPVTAALAEAKELEATLLRVKGMLK